MNLLSHRAIGLVAQEFFKGMGQGGQNHGQVFADAFGAAGQIDDQSALTHTDHGARDHGMGSFFQACGPHGFGHAGHFEIDDGPHGLGRDIRGAQAGAAGGDDQIKMFLVHPLEQSLDNGGGMVRDYFSQGDGEARGLQNFSGGFAAQIFPQALRAFVTEG